MRQADHCDGAVQAVTIFYKHYRDASDLLEQIEAETLDHLRDTAQQILGEDALGHFIRLLEGLRGTTRSLPSSPRETGSAFFSAGIPPAYMKRSGTPYSVISRWRQRRKRP